jgi:hypothetical protein
MYRAQALSSPSCSVIVLGFFLLERWERERYQITEMLDGMDFFL